MQVPKKSSSESELSLIIGALGINDLADTSFDELIPDAASTKIIPSYPGLDTTIPDNEPDLCYIGDKSSRLLNWLLPTTVFTVSCGDNIGYIMKKDLNFKWTEDRHKLKLVHLGAGVQAMAADEYARMCGKKTSDLNKSLSAITIMCINSSVELVYQAFPNGDVNPQKFFEILRRAGRYGYDNVTGDVFMNVGDKKLVLTDGDNEPTPSQDAKIDDGKLKEAEEKKIAAPPTPRMTTRSQMKKRAK